MAGASTRPDSQCFSTTLSILTPILALASDLKGALASIALLTAPCATPLAAAAPAGALAGVAMTPFYMEKILVGLMAARLRFDPGYAKEVRRHEFNKYDPSEQLKYCNLALGLGGRLDIRDILKEKLLSKDAKDNDYKLYTIDADFLHNIASRLSPNHLAELQALAAERNATLSGYIGAGVGGVLGGIDQAGMIHSSHYSFLPDGVNTIAAIVGFANIFAMYPSTLRTPEAFNKLFLAISNHNAIATGCQLSKVAWACGTSFSYISGGAHLSRICLEGVGMASDAALPLGWILGIITAIPVIGQSMSATDDFSSQIYTDGAFDCTKTKAYFQKNAWGMLVCGITNALPSAWFAGASAFALGGAALAAPLIAITILSTILTKGPATQRFLDSCAQSECISYCLRGCRSASVPETFTEPLLEDPTESAIKLINSVLATGDGVAIKALAEKAQAAAGLTAALTDAATGAAKDRLESQPHRSSMTSIDSSATSVSIASMPEAATTFAHTAFIPLPEITGQYPSIN